MKIQRRRQRSSSGFGAQDGLTLVELMVVVVILVVLAAVAVPMFSRDNVQRDFDRFVKEFSQELARARIESASRREDRGVLIVSDKEYHVISAIPGGSDLAVLRRVRAPEAVHLAGRIGQASIPGTGYVSFSESGSVGAEIRFTGIGDVIHNIGQTLGPGGATVYFKAEIDGDIRHAARVVIHQSTGNTHSYDRW